MVGAENPSPLAGKKINIIGAGPAGLQAATGANRLGAEVTVFEALGDPRGPDAGYTRRSFNFTINRAVKKEFYAKNALRGGIKLYGRAIHRPGEETEHTLYGGYKSHAITSIPRPRLRQNLSKVAQQEGVNLKFNAKIAQIEPDTGTVILKDGEQHKGDLVFIADGLHSMGDPLIEALDGGKVVMREEPRSYVTAMLPPERTSGLSLNHLHFWKQPESEDSVAIGVPNADGSIAVLLISEYADLARDAYPFKTPEEATERLKKDFPQILAIDPDLPNRLPQGQRGPLYYKSVSHFVIDDKAVIVGDAGHAAPPWAGFGANTALHAARYLIDSIQAQQGDLKTALLIYQTYYRALSYLLHPAIEAHGDFISKQVMTNTKGRSGGEFKRILANAAEVVKAEFDY